MHILKHFSERKEMQVSLWSVFWQSTIKPWPPYSHMGLNTTNMLYKLYSNHLLCSNACPWLVGILLFNSSAQLLTYMHGGQGESPVDETQFPAGPTKYLLGHTGHFYSQWLWEIGGNQKNWALKVKRLFTQVHVCHFQKLQAQINKRKNALLQCELLSTCTILSFSSPRIARKILKWILSAQICSSFFFFFLPNPVFKYGLLCSIKMYFLLRTSRWSVSQTQSYNSLSAAPGKMKNRNKTF